MSDSLVLKCLKIGRSAERWESGQRAAPVRSLPPAHQLSPVRAYPTPPAPPRRNSRTARLSHTHLLPLPLQVSTDDLPAIFQKYGDDEFVMDLLEEFVREANTSLAVIETKDDARAVQSAAHRIKGSAGNLDLHSIRQIAEVVEVNAVSDGVEWPYRGGDGGGADEGDGEFDAVVRAAAPLLPRRAPRGRSHAAAPSAGLATQGARQARRRPTTARRRATKGGRDRLGVVGDVERQVVDGVDRLTRVPPPSSSHLVCPYEEVWQPWQVCDRVKCDPSDRSDLVGECATRPRAICA